MDMPLDPAVKSDYEAKVAEAIANALEKEELSLSEYSILRKALLATFPEITTTEQLENYLRELSVSYLFFSDILAELLLNKEEQKAQSNVSYAESLIKENKVDEALQSFSSNE